MKQIRPDALILDGGLATELQARGCDISGALWSARVLRTAPETLDAVAQTVAPQADLEPTLVLRALRQTQDQLDEAVANGRA